MRIILAQMFFISNFMDVTGLERLTSRFQFFVSLSVNRLQNTTGIDIYR